MRAIEAKQPGSAAAIPKENQVLSQQSDRGRLPRERSEPLSKLGYCSGFAFEKDLLIAIPKRFYTAPMI
jgi:hypothetical protein